MKQLQDRSLFLMHLDDTSYGWHQTYLTSRYIEYFYLAAAPLVCSVMSTASNNGSRLLWEDEK
jgi:hypothetical protein